MWMPGTGSLRQLSQWHLRSHYGARRNALVASTLLAERRREQREVEEFLRLRHVVAESEPMAPGQLA